VRDDENLIFELTIKLGVLTIHADAQEREFIKELPSKSEGEHEDTCRVGVSNLIAQRNCLIRAYVKNKQAG